ncbi:hypothetical protein N9339_00070 [Candidatus Pelagibacter sp.]|nr:hypothetical protein [Candidatus Pelagibacter sp.]
MNYPKRINKDLNNNVFEYDGYDFESVAEKIKIDFVKVDEFDPSEYFSNLSTTWDLSKNRAAVDKGLTLCK